MGHFCFSSLHAHGLTILHHTALTLSLQLSLSLGCNCDDSLTTWQVKRGHPTVGWSLHRPNLGPRPGQEVGNTLYCIDPVSAWRVMRACLIWFVNHSVKNDEQFRCFLHVYLFTNHPKFWPRVRQHSRANAQPEDFDGAVFHICNFPFMVSKSAL